MWLKSCHVRCVTCGVGGMNQRWARTSRAHVDIKHGGRPRMGVLETFKCARVQRTVLSFVQCIYAWPFRFKVSFY
jgi:hypothetical protein